MNLSYLISNIRQFYDYMNSTESKGYVLLLENDKYYVGITSNYKQRMENHFNGRGSEWTKLHKPIRVIETFEGSSENEKLKTLFYMKKFG